MATAKNLTKKPATAKKSEESVVEESVVETEVTETAEEAPVKVEDTIRGFQEIIDGKHDDLPEQAFYMVGTIEEAVEKAKTLAE